MFILRMILHFTKKQHYKLFGCHDSASLYKQMSDFNKMLYIFKTVTTFLLPKQDSICATHAIFWRFCLITLSHRFPTNTLYSYILIGKKSCQTVTTRVPISKGKIQLFFFYIEI